jgi:myo-inositol-1(or 4)-monophosphatase
MDSLKFTENLAKNAGKILFNRFWNHSISSHLKGDHSPVTEADLYIDDLITTTIRYAYPDDGLISEENQQTYHKNSAAVWVIDPLDGTANFGNGIPVWGVSIARLIDGWPDLGVLYFPVTGDLFSARHGGGAIHNGRPLRSNQSNPTSFFACCSRTHRKYQIEVPYKARISGSVAFNMAAVARGAAVINLEVAPKLWDIAAGWLILQESGAEVEIFASESPFPVVPNIDYDQPRFSTLAAVSKSELQKAHRWIHPRPGQVTTNVKENESFGNE